MKQLFLIFAFSIGTYLQAQLIPNGGFENWVQESYGEEPANWGELSLQLMYGIIPNLVDSTIVKTQDAYSGSFAMELRSKKLSGFMSDTIIPVVMLNLKNSNLDSAKMKIDGKLESLTGYIKQDIVDAEENATSISLIVYSEGDIIGIGGVEFDSDIDEYTSFEMPIYYLEEGTGDSIEIMITVGNSEAPVPGNIMVLDNFKLNYQSITTSLKENRQAQIKVYPNPFLDWLTIDCKTSAAKDYKIYSTLGEVVRKGTISSTMNAIDLSNLPPNVYILKTESQTIKLIKKK